MAQPLLAAIETLKAFRQATIIITKDQTGQIIWLERGNPGAGCKHLILREHIEQIAEKAGIEAEKVVEYIFEIVSYGEKYMKEYSNRIYFKYEGIEYATVIGSNGFIVSIWPEK